MKTLKFLGIVGLLAILAVLGSAAYVFSGYYSVAASEDDPQPVKWVLAKVREASVAHHGTMKPAVALDDASVIQAGARAFAARGCATCHGAPGRDWAKFAEGLRPDPPDLSDVAKAVDASQIFWVVKNGIKFTGMPSFGAIGATDDELWSIAAFVKKLPGVTPDDFKAWTAAPAANP